jgi:hypothetical protein
LFLPIAGGVPDDTRLQATLGNDRRVDEVRRRMGGRASSDPGVGQLVRLRLSDEYGVVLFRTGEQLDVWLGGGKVQRTGQAAVEPLRPSTEPADPHSSDSAGRRTAGPARPAQLPELLGVAADVRVFASLNEGARVRYSATSDSMEEGTLVEKCRYGALILRDDNTLMGVGFRRIWPVNISQKLSS